jgi:hypothetical protein
MPVFTSAELCFASIENENRLRKIFALELIGASLLPVFASRVRAASFGALPNPLP